MEENTERIFNDWKKHVTKRDTVYILGDFCFDKDVWVTVLDELDANKIYLIRGNHDDKFTTSELLEFFDEVYGLVKYKEFWLSHSPIHSDELRGKINLHGHVHYHTVNDSRYFNCCPENLWPKYGRCLVSLNELRTHFNI